MSHPLPSPFPSPRSSKNPVPSPNQISSSPTSPCSFPRQSITHSSRSFSRSPCNPSPPPKSTRKATFTSTAVRSSTTKSVALTPSIRSAAPPADGCESCPRVWNCVRPVPQSTRTTSSPTRTASESTSAARPQASATGSASQQTATTSYSVQRTCTSVTSGSSP